MKIVAFKSAMLLIVINAGCTARNTYEGLRMQQEMECLKLDRNECTRRSGMSYDEYQRQLKKRYNNAFIQEGRQI